MFEGIGGLIKSIGGIIVLVTGLVNKIDMLIMYIFEIDEWYN